MRAGPATIAGNRNEFVGRETECRTRVPSAGDIRVELIRARAKTLGLVGLRNEHSVLHQQRTGLQEVASRSQRKPVTAADSDSAAVDCDCGPNSAERVMHRDRTRLPPREPEVAEWAPARADVKTIHNGFADAAAPASAIKRFRPS